jgi:hypothetical protein
MFLNFLYQPLYNISGHYNHFGTHGRWELKMIFDGMILIKIVLKTVSSFGRNLRNIDTHIQTQRHTNISRMKQD